MSCTQFHSIKLFILRHAWLNLWDKHMTTGRINQVTFHRSILSKTLSKKKRELKREPPKKVCSPKTSTIWRCLFNVSLISFPWLMFIFKRNFIKHRKPPAPEWRRGSVWTTSLVSLFSFYDWDRYKAGWKNTLSIELTGVQALRNTDRTRASRTINRASTL